MAGVSLEKNDASLKSDHAGEAPKTVAKAKASTKGSAKANKMSNRKLSNEGVEISKKEGKRASAPLVEGDPLAVRMSAVSTADAFASEDSKSLSDFING